MGADYWVAGAAAASAVAALAALAVAVIGLRHQRRTARYQARKEASEMDAALQLRMDPLYPGLRKVLGHLEDGVPHEIREVLIPFFVLFSDAFAANRDGLLDPGDWDGFGRELAFWAQKPTARRAWKAFRQQEWTPGFRDHVDTIIAGPAAYPSLTEIAVSHPEIQWPGDESEDAPKGAVPS